MSNAQNALVSRCLSSLRFGPTDNPEFSGALRSMDEISAVLARNAAERETIGRSVPRIWEPLSQVWDALSARDIDTLVASSTQRAWTLCIARFTRNLVAENQKNQTEAFKFEPEIRSVAHAYTSHILVLDEEEFMTTRFLIQTISNIVTGNEELLQQLWGAYMVLSEEKNILMRAVAHPDDRTAATAVILIANFLHASCERMRLLINSSMGRRLCILLLDRLARYIENSDENDRSDLFSVGWSIFRTLFDNGLVSALLSLTTMDGEVVNPQQTTLLKLLDAYLMQALAPSPERANTDATVTPDIPRELLTIILKLIHSATASIRLSMGQPDSRIQLTGNDDENTARPLQSLDVLLPKVCEAIVIVVQCFCSMTLAQDAKGDLTEDVRWTRRLLIESSPPNSIGLIEDLIDLLRLLGAFLPRIMFGRGSYGTTRPNVNSSEQIDKKEDKGFTYLKRDLIRLLGILCFEDRAVQDRVRRCDGIPIVMNLCVTDERNPYLREHALFALRNLLHNNRENQAVVDAIKPVGALDENSILRDVLGTQT